MVDQLNSISENYVFTCGLIIVQQIPSLYFKRLDLRNQSQLMILHAKRLPVLIK